MSETFNFDYNGHQIEVTYSSYPAERDVGIYGGAEITTVIKITSGNPCLCDLCGAKMKKAPEKGALSCSGIELPTLGL